MKWLKMILKNETVVAAAKTLGKAVLYATLSAFGVTWLSGCSSTRPQTRGQTTEIVAVGIPAIAWITHATMNENNQEGDTNATTQANPIIVGK